MHIFNKFIITIGIYYPFTKLFIRMICTSPLWLLVLLQKKKLWLLVPWFCLLHSGLNVFNISVQFYNLAFKQC
jgi:hypothetical protein